MNLWMMSGGARGGPPKTPQHQDRPQTPPQKPLSTRFGPKKPPPNPHSKAWSLKSPQNPSEPRLVPKSPPKTLQNQVLAPKTPQHHFLDPKCPELSPKEPPGCSLSSFSISTVRLLASTITLYSGAASTGPKTGEKKGKNGPKRGGGGRNPAKRERRGGKIGKI